MFDFTALIAALFAIAPIHAASPCRALYPGSAWAHTDRRLCLSEAVRTQSSWQIAVDATRQSLGTARYQAEPGNEAETERIPCNTVKDLERELAKDLEDGNLDQFSLFEAALVAGGVTSRDELNHRNKHFDEVCRLVEGEVERVFSSRSKLDVVLRQLHAHFLTGEYRAEFSELQRTLDTGHYNCVTATILFQAISDRCGLNTQAIAAPSHVMSCWHGTPNLYIEPTCQEWQSASIETCDPRTKQLALISRELTDAQLLSKVMYNRGVAELERKRFPDAATRLIAARQLDPQDQATRENLLAAYNNWALAECDAGQFGLAAELLLRGLVIDDHYAPLLRNDLHIHQRWVKKLCDAKEFGAAVQVLEDCYKRRPSAELFNLGRSAVYDLWARHHFMRGEFVEGWNVFSAAEQRFGSHYDSAREIAIIQTTHGELIARSQAEIAHRLVEQAGRRYPKSVELLRLFREN
jgi:tetratricopeptide (TPR) repeat protein